MRTDGRVTEILPRLATGRLIVRTATPDDVPRILHYYRENEEHLRPFEPARTRSFFEEEFWSVRVLQDADEFLEDRSVRLFLFSRRDPERVVGAVNFTQIVRGVAQSCSLGYSLAEAEQGKGLMQEALESAIPFLFGTLHLHRIEANYMPHNRRSGALLRRLGFVVEGYARDYLLINGQWEDHVLTSLTNAAWGSRRGAAHQAP